MINVGMNQGILPKGEKVKYFFMKTLKRFLLSAALAVALTTTACGQTAEGNDRIGTGEAVRSERSSFLFVMSTSYIEGDEEYNGGFLKSGTMKIGDRAMLVKSDGSSYEVQIGRMALYEDEEDEELTEVEEAGEGPVVYVWLRETLSEEAQKQAFRKWPEGLGYGDMLLGMKEWEQGISLEFPFEASEKYSLVFAPRENEKEQGEFRLCEGSGTVLQRIPYGVFELPEYYVFNRDGKQHLLFFTPAGYYSAEKYCFTWEGDRFAEAETDIRRGVTAYLSDLLVTEENETACTMAIYRTHLNSRQAEEIRRFSLQKDTGKLAIWDCLDQKTVYDAVVPMKEGGVPVNEEYYQVLFTEGLYPWAWEQEEEPSFFVQTNLETVEELYTEYESREAFLADYGFAEDKPFYQYCDRMGNLRLELYEDKDASLFGGVMYQYYYTDDKQKYAKMSGFVIDSVGEAAWEEDPYAEMSLLEGPDYEKSTEYTAEGKPTYFIVKGDDGTVEREEEPVMLMEIDYIYRDDGTLYDKHYRHDPYLFGTTRQSEDSLYDEQGRLVYRQAYITHGTLEDYYIYPDKNGRPAYRLEFDYGMGPVPIATMEQYR